jgi:hypothetical protein
MYYIIGNIRYHICVRQCRFKAFIGVASTHNSIITSNRGLKNLFFILITIDDRETNVGSSTY